MSFMCEDSNFIECESLDDAIEEHIFDKKMESIIKKRLEDGQKPIPVNIEDLL